MTCDLALRGQHLFGFRHHPERRQVTGGTGGRGTGLDHGVGDVFGAFKHAADIDSRLGGGHGVEAPGAGETVLVEVDADFFRQFFGLRRHPKTGGQDHHIEIFDLQGAVAFGEIPDLEITRGGPGVDNGFHGVGPGAHQADAVIMDGPLEIALVIFARGAHVHVEQRRLHVIIEALPGDDGLLEGEHAAGAGAVRHRALLNPPGPDALNPGDLLGPFAIRRPHQLALGRPGRGENPLIFQAGDHVGVDAIAVGVQNLRIEHVRAGRQNHGPDLHLLHFFGVIRQNGAGGADVGQGLKVGGRVFYDGIGIRGPLGIAHAGGGPMVETGGEAHRVGKLAVTLTAPRAFPQIDVPGLRRQLCCETACLPGKTGQLRHGHELDVQLTPAFRQMGRQGAEIAIIGGKGTVELGHETADGEALVDQHHVPARFRQVQGGPDAAHTPTDHKHLIAEFFWLCHDYPVFSLRFL